MTDGTQNQGCSRCARLEVEPAELRERLFALEAELAKAKKHSGNSSKPPSGDIVQPKKTKKRGRPRKRKIGGQPGHERYMREPFRREELDHQWLFSIRTYKPFGGIHYPMRCRSYWESPDLITGLPWKPYEPPLWVGADRLDVGNATDKHQPELYNLDAVGYESLMLGLFSIHREAANMKLKRPKINEVCLGFSRDGFHWDRPDRRPFLRVSENKDDWNWGNVQSVGGGCLVVGDELYFFASGRKGNAPHFHDAGGSTGLAVLRRDGFASMDASTEYGVLLTRPVRFTGKHLFVNVDCDDGEFRAEILDETERVIGPFSYEQCARIQADKTLYQVRWNGTNDLSEVVGETVRFRFHLRQGRLYGFWVSPNESGASHGCVAAGGPGLDCPTDTVGSAAYLH